MQLLFLNESDDYIFLLDRCFKFAGTWKIDQTDQWVTDTLHAQLLVLWSHRGPINSSPPPLELLI